MEITTERMKIIHDLSQRISSSLKNKTITLNTIKSLVRDLGGSFSLLNVKNSDYKNIIKKNNDKFSVEVYENKKENFVFNSAHALGHLIVHLGVLNDEKAWNSFDVFEDNYGQNVIEIEADYFAECLLMPDELFKKECGKYSMFTNDSIKDIAFRFNVPINKVIKKGLRLKLITIE